MNYFYKEFYHGVINAVSNFPFQNQEGRLMKNNTLSLLGKETLRSVALLFVFIVGILSIISSGGGNGDDPGILQFKNTTYNITEGADPTVTITVTRTEGSDGAVSVDYATSDGTASDPSDYTSASGTLNWADGDAADKTFSINITDDSAVETAEDFTVVLSNVQTAKLGSNTSAIINISDNDAIGTLQFNSSAYAVTEGTDPVVTITVTRTGGSAGPVSVDYATSNGTAVDPSDYTSTSGSLSWVDGDAAAKNFTVTIINDSVVENTESFNVTLSNVVNATLGANTITTVTINNDDLIPISGTVSAPSGTLAFKGQGLLQRMFAALFGNKLNAAISDIVSPVVGATVSIFEVDASGNLVGAAIDTDTTDGAGAYTMSAPVDALDSVKYIVRASGATEVMDSRIVSNIVDVDPATDATSRMVSSVVSDLSEISLQEVMEMQIEFDELISDISTAGATATQISERLFSKAEVQVGLYNMIRSKVSSGKICGHVESVSASPLDDIYIVVRDYDDRTTRASAYTDDSGNYCVNVPVQGVTDPDGGVFSGEYIIGAINRTDDSTDIERSASEWLGSGTTYTEFEAIKIAVPTSTPVSGIDFALEPGVRITGSVKSTGSLLPVEGVQVVVRDFDTERRLASARVESDGSYSVTVIPGSYLIAAKNRTVAGYASEFYDDANGTNNPNLSSLLSAVAGDELVVDFELEPGSQISGNINDGAPLVNEQIRINISDNAFSENESTDRNGDYNIWLKPGSYDLYAHGELNLGTDLTSSTIVNFTGAVSTISGQLKDSSNNPVRNAGVWLYSKPDATTTDLIDVTSSDSYGNFTAYSSVIGDHLLLPRISRDSAVSSVVYMNQTRLLSGDVIDITNVGNTIDLSSVSLPDGGMLKGNVYADSSGSITLPLGNFRVQIRDNGTTTDDRFIQVRTRSDGSYRVALPAGTYDRVKMRDATNAATGNGNCNNVVIAASATITLNFYDGNNTCEIVP
jgi:hypothetical protein